MDWDFWINTGQWMVIVFQAQRRTTSLAPLKKVVFDKLQIQVSLPLLKLIKSIPLCKEKFKLMYIYATAILIWARLVLKEFNNNNNNNNINKSNG